MIWKRPALDAPREANAIDRVETAPIGRSGSLGRRRGKGGTTF